MSIKSTKEILFEAREAKNALALADEKTLNLALQNMAKALIEDADEILSANQSDLDAARQNQSISSVMLDRLCLNRQRIEGMAKGILEVSELPSPTGKILYEDTRPNGLNIQRISVPFGVVAIIYESRPNVTSDAAALALKSGNVCVLRGGKEAFSSAKAIVKALRRGISEAGLPENAINLIEDTTRQSATELMTADGFVDMLIPRGGAGLIRACVENATVPCIQTGTGICHIYVDKSAKLDMALEIIENAKTSRPSVCNAAEVCIIHKDVACELLPKLYQKLVVERREASLVPVTFKCDADALEILNNAKCDANIDAASDGDFDTEFLDYIMAVKLVGSVDEAICHIAKHSTHHSEAIIAEEQSAVAKFTTMVDSAAVYVNASTRFTDGGEFGFGCEMGISTQKNHPRGPMGLPELTTYKYVIRGNGQIRR